MLDAARRSSAAADGRRPAARDHRPRHARRLPRAASPPGAAAGRPRAHPGGRDQHHRDRATSALWEGELHILGLRGRSGRRRVRGGPGRAARAAARRFERTVARLRELGMPIDDQIAEQLDAGRRRARPADGRAGAGRRRATRRASRTRSRRSVGWGSPAYVPRRGWARARRSRRSGAAGGLPVLAHFSEAPSAGRLVRELVDAGLGGLEVYYRTLRLGDGRSRVGAVAAELGLVPTGGTDYHGDTAPTPRRTRSCGSRPRSRPSRPRWPRGVGVEGSPAQP